MNWYEAEGIIEAICKGLIDLENLDLLSIIHPFVQSSGKIIDQSGHDMNLDHREYFVTIINEN